MSAPRDGGEAAANARHTAITKLLSYAFQPAFDSDHSVAEVLFWGNLIRDGATNELQWLLASEDATIKYNSWFLFDWEVDGSGTVAELFLEEGDAELTMAERQFLNRLSRTHLRLYEVEAVDRGEGVWLVDLWTGTRLFVIEHTATKQMVSWDLLGARVAPDGTGGNVFEGGIYLYPVHVKEEVIAHFRRLYRKNHRKFPLDELADFFRKHGVVFHHLWLNLVAFPEPPEIVTSEGDPLVFCRSVFDSDQAEEIRGLLAGQPDISVDEEGHFSWREMGEEGEREIGTWVFEGRRIAFETTSQERAARGRAWLERLAGGRVRYRATALETLEQAFKDLRRHGPRRPLTEDPVPETGAVREMFDRHYRAWVDRPAAALGNRTPRAAAKTRLWRPKLIALLKELENGSERAALDGRPAYDFGWLWQELGLERPRAKGV